MRLLLTLVSAPATALAQSPAPPAPATAPATARIQATTDSIRATGAFPGISIGIVLPDGRSIALSSGLADTALRTPLRPTDLLLAGSVGKTYVAAVALQLVHERRLDLDAPISRYLGNEAWFPRLPNASGITVRMLMNHTSGLVRYEFQEAFTRDLTASPDRIWKPAELLAYILNTTPPFPPGGGWEYSDTNYIVLGLIIEHLTGKRLNDEIAQRILKPLHLAHTVPSDRRRIPGLAQGYAGHANPFGGTDAMIVDGAFAINPQFEWAGGGYATSPQDLARWAFALYQGRAFDPSLLPLMLEGVPARLGPDAKYGLGVIIRPTPLGPSYGHSGFFPGYLTEMRYFPDHRIAVAFQINSSVPRALGRSPGAVIDALARAALGM